MRPYPSLFIATCALILAACGSSGSSASGGGDQIRNADPWTEEQVAAAAHLTADEDGLAWTTPSGCSVAVILVSRANVDLYAGAGDPVATNPDGTAGVKFDGTQECGAELASGLKSLR
jgi:hypothetical protein